MFRLWAKLFKDNRLLKDTVICDASADTRTHKVFRALDEICIQFDLGKPLWLDATVNDFKRHSKARFRPFFRRSTRKVPAFSSSHFFTFSPEPRLFLYLRHIFNALWGLFLLKIFLEYSIIMVLYGTLLGGQLWRTFYDRKKRKKDSICKCMTPTGTRR